MNRHSQTVKKLTYVTTGRDGVFTETSNFSSGGSSNLKEIGLRRTVTSQARQRASQQAMFWAVSALSPNPKNMREVSEKSWENTISVWNDLKNCTSSDHDFIRVHAHIVAGQNEVLPDNWDQPGLGGLLIRGFQMFLELLQGIFGRAK